ncbi:hypothetical protein M0805_005842 [Coniferiporia weirii]|nr:hypothetical protein M0805_005842 [Coniferiporia weirii]
MESLSAADLRTSSRADEEHAAINDAVTGQLQEPTEGTADASDSSRPLNVTDALSYLDAVKTQFVERPDVYNNFLDIMKDFKGQVIDTPGVIERVSSLFRGHNDLIQGFNTFLPPGYRIECSRNALEATTITVTTPAGTTTQSTDGQQQIPRASPAVSPSPAPVLVATNLTVKPQPDSPSNPLDPTLPFGTSSAATMLGGMSIKDSPDRGRPGPAGAQEFHHAIQYVNKIKTRFEDDPETYKYFLEILHSYRKDQNHDDVYHQVQLLFKDAPDLLAEFKNFLPPDGGEPSFAPETPGDAVWADVDSKKGLKVEGPSVAKRKKKPLEKEIQPAPPAVPIASKSKKPKHGHVKETIIPPSPSYHPYSRPPSPSHHPHPHHHPHQHAGPSTSQTAGAGAVGANTNVQDELAFFDRAKKALESRETYDEFLKLLNLFSREIIDARMLIQRAGTFLGDGELYGQFKDLMGWDDKRNGENEGPPGSIRNWAAPPTEMEERFGKSYRRLPLAETKLACSGRDELCRNVLNDVWVSHPTWASEESGFISHKKNSYEEALHKSEEERHEFQFYIDIITRTIALFQPLYDRIMEMNADERHAYRLPADFGGSSKGIYHRAIKKVYGRDSQGMEVLQALQECPAIAVPVVLPRLKQKNEEWRRAQREWNRVWREVDARNFYKSLDHQGITFKANDKKYITTKSFVAEIENAKAEISERIVIGRTKAKVSRKDKKRLSSASSPDGLRVKEKPYEDVNDIECAPHLEFSFSDLSVLQDALKLVFSFLDRSTIQYSSHERRTVERMLRSFIPTFYMLPAEFDSAFGPPIEADGTDNEDGAADDPAVASDEGDESHHGSGSKSHNKSGGTSGRRSAGGSGHGHGGVHPSDLRKKLLKTAQEKAAKARSGSASASRAVSPTGSDDDHARHADGHAASASPTSRRKKNARSKEVPETQHLECEEWVKLMPVAFDTGKETRAKDGMDIDADDAFERLAKQGLVDEKPFFTNTTFYSLLRLLQLLYLRLLRCKEIGAQLVTQDSKKSVFTVNEVAEQLGLVDAHGPGAVLALAANVPAHPPHVTTTSEVVDMRMGGAPEVDGNNDQNQADADRANGGAVSPRTQDRPEAHFYGYLLDACEKLFEGELDQATFEENMRFLFGTKAYNMFTLDKLIAALIKQVQTAVVDSKCQELLALLGKARSKGPSSVRELIAYRREAEQYLGPDDHLYRVEWDEGLRMMRIWLLSAAEASINLNLSSNAVARADARTREAVRWRTYAESYVLAHPTELVDEERVRAQMRRPFLSRTRDGSEDEHDAAMGAGAGPGPGPGLGGAGERVPGRGRWAGEGELEVGIQPGTYKLVYKDGSAECGYAVRT